MRQNKLIECHFKSNNKNNYGGAIKFELPIIPNYANIFYNDMQRNK